MIQLPNFDCSYQTLTVSSSMGSSNFTNIPCPWGLGGDLRFLPYFDFVAAGSIGFHKHMSSLPGAIHAQVNVKHVFSMSLLNQTWTERVNLRLLTLQWHHTILERGNNQNNFKSFVLYGLCFHQGFCVSQTYLVIPPATKLGGGVYWNHPVRLSVRLSVDARG